MAFLKPDPVSELEKPAKAKVRRHLLLRLFGIKIWGWVKLVLLCILVGFFVMAAEFDPTNPNVDVTSALGEFASTALAAARWAVLNFWKPAMAGASIVLPIWFLWRLLTLPFRK